MKLDVRSGFSYISYTRHGGYRFVNDDAWPMLDDYAFSDDARYRCMHDITMLRTLHTFSSVRVKR